MLKNIPINDAAALLLEQAAVPARETVPLFAAQGRVLARDIRACINVPGFDRSPYDGYALRGEDTAAASAESPVVLRITEELPAGTAPSVPVTPGTAAKILTGAPIPPGANAVVKYEDTDFTAGTVSIKKPVRPDTDIVRAGEDITEGALIAAAGTVITPALAGLMAGQGMAQAEVFRRPRVFVMSTGSELLDPGEEYVPAKIYNSNVFTISAYLTAMGAECVSGGSVPDEPDTIAARIAAAAEEYDLVVTTGGASVGDYDYAVRASERAGAEVMFWKTSMKPGGSMAAARKGKTVILSLSGNPGAACIALLRVCSPLVKRLCGRSDFALRPMTVRLKNGLPKKSVKQRILRGYLSIENGEAWFVPTEGQGNGVVSSLLGSDMLGEIPASSPPQPEGALITAYRI
jgi:molybdopterin molybdotransferase